MRKDVEESVKQSMREESEITEWSTQIYMVWNHKTTDLPQSACWHVHGTPGHIPWPLSHCHFWQLRLGPGGERWSPGKSLKHGPSQLYAAMEKDLEFKISGTNIIGMLFECVSWQQQIRRLFCSGFCCNMALK